MIRINTSGCGWSVIGGTYSCSGLPKLDPVFQHTHLTGGTVSGYEEVDMYDKIPQHIEGFVMTLTPIIDMSGEPNPPEVPELACRVDFDPFSESPKCVLNTDDPKLTANLATKDQGFIDLYNQVPSYKSSFYVVRKVQVTVPGATYHMRTESDFPIYGNAGIMAPGVLEPMLDTMFGPVDIDMPPTPDLTTDAIIYSLAGLQSWRHTIDGRVSDTYINAVDYGLLGLANQANQKGTCTNFQISVNGTEPVTVIGTPRYFDKESGANRPTYSISGGNINLNGTSTEIEGYADEAKPPFTAYLDVVPDGTTASIIVRDTDYIDPEDRVEGHTYLYIGSVRSVQEPSAFIAGSTTFRLYDIVQGDCIEDVRTQFGDKNKEYPGPFVVIHNADTDTLSVSGFDVDSGQTPRAGKIFIDGSSVAWGPRGNVDTPEGAERDFVYAHIEVQDPGTSSVSVVGCTYSTSDVPVPQGTATFTYTIRLAGFVSGELEQIHYGDIYLYTRGSGGGGGYYVGPFRVQQGTWSGGSSEGFCVKGVQYEEGNVNDPLKRIAGKIFINGVEDPYECLEADVYNAEIGENVYANIYIRPTETGYAVTGCTYTCTEVTTPATPDGLVYNVRLGRLPNNSIVEQTHFGDIYIDLAETTTTSKAAYEGPFTVNDDGTVTCDVCPPHGTDSVAGYVILSGGSPRPYTYDADSPPSVTLTGTSDIDVYLKVKPDANHVPSPDITSSFDSDANCYNVRLGIMKYSVDVGGNTIWKAVQLHYGDVYVDGRWL